MKFRIDELDPHDWHRVFVVSPVSIGDEYYAWLEWVERRLICGHRYEYREIDKTNIP